MSRASQARSVARAHELELFAFSTKIYFDCTQSFVNCQLSKGPYLELVQTAANHDLSKK